MFNNLFVCLAKVTHQTHLFHANIEAYAKNHNLTDYYAPARNKYSNP